MQMVAAAKLRRAQQSIERARPYSLKLRDTIAHLASRTDHNAHLLLRDHQTDNTAYMVVTGDRGLCGSFNSNIIRKAESIVKPSDEMVLVGRKGVDYFGKRGFNIGQKHSNIFRELNFGHAVSIGEMLVRYYAENRLDRVFLIYNEFKSVAQQFVVVEQLLPIIPAETPETHPVEFIFEPSPGAVLDKILPLSLNMQIWRVLLESNAAEQAARMTAMENATDAAQDMIDTLTLHYNKARQAAITKEILDIVGGVTGLE